MNDITFFTVNALDNGYFEDKLPSNDFLKLCLYSWVKEYNVVVYDYKHPIVKESVDYLKMYMAMILIKLILHIYLIL